MPQFISKTRLCELLHIDTQDSQKFFTEIGATHPEKCECQKTLEDTFVLCCRAFGGRVVRFEGDGGLAYFDAGRFSGGAIGAAERFFAELPRLHRKIGRVLRLRKVPRSQKFRLKGHFGPIYIDADRRHLASAANVIDSFVKKEKNIAPLSDQLFITDELYKATSSDQQAKFSLTGKRKQRFDRLYTLVYRLHKRPPDALLKPALQRGTTDITRKELNYLRRMIEMQVLLTTARNLITMGLTKRLVTSRTPMRSTDLVEATLQGIHTFMVSLNTEVTETFKVSFWCPNRTEKPTHLRKQSSFPDPGPKRTISLRDDRWQVVRSFTECTAIFHEDVRASTANGEWFPFDSRQGRRTRNLFSAAQFPVYRNKNEVGKPINRQVLGVLSIDTNCPEFFHSEDAQLWTDRIKGFLVNLALSQVIEQHH